jgi:hypothetical protein
MINRPARLQRVTDRGEAGLAIESLFDGYFGYSVKSVPRDSLLILSQSRSQDDGNDAKADSVCVSQRLLKVRLSKHVSSGITTLPS